MSWLTIGVICIPFLCLMSGVILAALVDISPSSSPSKKKKPKRSKLREREKRIVQREYDLDIMLRTLQIQEQALDSREKALEVREREVGVYGRLNYEEDLLKRAKMNGA